MTRPNEPTLNELVSFASESPFLFDFVQSPSYVFGSSVIPPLVLPPTTLPSDWVGAEEIRDQEESSLMEYSTRDHRNYLVRHRYKPYQRRFIDARTFLHTTDDQTELTPMLRRYKKQDDRWIDPWYTMTNQKPSWWKRRNYKKQGVNWRVDDPSGRPSLSWLSQYGNDEDRMAVKLLLKANSLPDDFGSNATDEGRGFFRKVVASNVVNAALAHYINKEWINEQDPGK